VGLDACLTAIEDSGFAPSGLRVGLRPVCEFRVVDPGTAAALAVLKYEAASCTWEWLKQELFRLSGALPTQLLLVSNRCWPD